MLGSIVWAFLANSISNVHSFGFRRIGSGGFRVAYLGPDGVVYKVDAGRGQDNSQEFRVWQSWQTNLHLLPDWCQLPKMWLYANGILACEYMGEDAIDLSYERKEELWRLGFSDLRKPNLRQLDDGKIAVIDLNVSLPVAEAVSYLWKG